MPEEGEDGAALVARSESKRDGRWGILSVYCDGSVSWRRFKPYKGEAWDLPPRAMSAKDKRLWDAR